MDSVVEILLEKKPSDTQRSEKLRFYFKLVVPYELTLKILWPPTNEFTGFLKAVHGIRLQGMC
jgi:hypothetical protein